MIRGARPGDHEPTRPRAPPQPDLTVTTAEVALQFPAFMRLVRFTLKTPYSEVPIHPGPAPALVLAAQDQVFDVVAVDLEPLQRRPGPSDRRQVDPALAVKRHALDPKAPLLLRIRVAMVPDGDLSLAIYDPVPGHIGAHW